MARGLGSGDKLYDKTTSMYSPEGRILQLEYARKAMNRGRTTIVIVSKDFVVLGGLIAKSKLLKPIQKIFQIDDHIAVSYTGYTADGHVLISMIRQLAYDNRILLGEEIDVMTLASKLGEIMQQYTQYGGVRPFGAGVIIAGYTVNGPEAAFIDPGGSIFGLNAYCVGKACEEILLMLKDKYKPDLSEDEAIRIAVEAIYMAMEAEASKEEKKRSEFEREVSPDRVVLVVIDKSGVRSVPVEKIDKYLKEIMEERKKSKEGGDSN